MASSSRHIENVSPVESDRRSYPYEIMEIMLDYPLHFFPYIISKHRRLELLDSM